MHRNVLAALASSLLLGLVACSAPTAAPSAAGSGSAPSSAAGPSTSGPASSTAPTSEGSSPAGAASGEITFTGALSGRMTVATCHDGLAQLVVRFDGEDKAYNGLIDADDFTFVAPGSGYTLADRASKPSVSGSTYTVRRTKLVSITTDDTVTADGSVTCP